jgi:Kef-type K+ transport system membrane component KefB
MIADLLVLSLLVALTWCVRCLPVGSFLNTGENAALVFGFVLLASYLVGKTTRRAKMPMLTGYLLAGVFFGPHFWSLFETSFRIISVDVLEELSIINSMALGLIAFSAGGEMRIGVLRERLKTIFSITAGQTLFAFVLVLTAAIVLGPYAPLSAGLSKSGILGIGIIFCVITLANSPSTAIALIIEYQARGPMTTTILGVTVLKDVLVIILFSLAMIAAKLLLGVGANANAILVGLVFWEVAGSLAIGCFLGFLMGQYMKYVGRELPVIVLFLAFAALELSTKLHLSGLLLCMSTGFYIENFTDQGKVLINAIERFSLPVFVLFFTIVGADMRLNALADVWPPVVVLVALRIASTWIGSRLGAAAAGESETSRKYVWTGFIPQAGVTLGLATVAAKLPGIGPELKTIIIATVAVNQLIGPLIFRYGLIRSGETSTT